MLHDWTGVFLAMPGSKFHRFCRHVAIKCTDEEGYYKVGPY